MAELLLLLEPLRVLTGITAKSNQRDLRLNERNKADDLWRKNEQKDRTWKLAAEMEDMVSNRHGNPLPLR